MKLLNDQFAEHLVKVFNLSLKRGVFPDSLKIAKVIPSHKKEVWNSRVTQNDVTLRVTNSKLKNKKLLFELLTQRFNFYFSTFELITRS